MERPSFTADKLLRAIDLSQEQRYQIDSYRAANRALHTWGIASGLDVVLDPEDPKGVVVQPGFALDSLGREIALAAPEKIDFGVVRQPESFVAPWNFRITICYHEDAASPARDARGLEFRACVVAPRVSSRCVSARSTRRDRDEEPSIEILLATIGLSKERYVASIDVDGRRYSGVRLHHVAFNPTGTGDDGTSISAIEPGELQFQASEMDVFGSVVVHGSMSVGSGVAPSNVGLEVVARPCNKLLAVVRFGDGRPLLAAASNGCVGIGTENPQSRLHVKGSLALDAGCALVLPEDGQLGILEGGPGQSHHLSDGIAFKASSLAVISKGDIRLISGANARTTDATLVVSAKRGHVGIGTSDAESELTVNGVIYAKDGLVFQNGERQTEGERELPIGAILDWYLWPEERNSPRLPAGFQLCDGSEVVDARSELAGLRVPDLNERLVLPIAGDQAPGEVGGGAAHTHQFKWQTTHSHGIQHTHPVSIELERTGPEGTANESSYYGTEELAGADHEHQVTASTSEYYPLQSGTFNGESTQETEGASSLPRCMRLLKIIRIW